MGFLLVSKAKSYNNIFSVLMPCDTDKDLNVFVAHKRCFIKLKNISVETKSMCTINFYLKVNPFKFTSEVGSKIRLTDIPI